MSEPQDQPSELSIVSCTGRTIYVSGDVDTQMAHDFLVALDKLDASEGAITVKINSDGGEESAGYAIYDALMMTKNQVIMEGYGCIASIAAAIFQAGDWRCLSPHSKFMIHNGHFDSISPIEQLQVVSLARQIEKDCEKYYQILANRSANAVEAVKEMCDAETWFDAQDAVEAGFADELLVSRKAFAVVPGKKKRKKKVK